MATKEFNYHAFDIEVRHSRSRSSSTRRTGGGNERGTSVNQPSSQHSTQQKSSNNNHHSGSKKAQNQRPHTAEQNARRSRATSKSMKITPTSLSTANTARSKPASSESRNLLQGM